MDLLLINSPLFDLPGERLEDTLPPLGLGYLATAVENAGFKVELFDAIANDCGTAGVINKIQACCPRFVGLNIFSTNLDLVRQIATADFDAHIIIGGPAIHALVETIFEWNTANPITIFEGEAEHALPAFLKGQLPSQPWMTRRNQSILNISPDHSHFPHDIDLPLRREFFQQEPLIDTTWNIKEAHILTSRGCGHNCAFCAAARSVNPTPIRYRSEAHICNEIEQIRTLMQGIDGIRIIDDLFIRNHRAIKRACNLFRNTGLSWRAMAHVNGFRGASKSLYEEMKRSGCLELFVGVESGNPTRRKAIGKQAEIEQTTHIIENLLYSGIAVKAYFIFGFPGETKQEMEDTYAVARRMADTAIKSGTHFRTSVFKFRPYHGTQIYNSLVASGTKIGRIAGDLKLTANNNNSRRQFSFMSNNLSSVDLDTLNGFINATQGIRV